MAEPASQAVARPPRPWSVSATRECSTPSGREKISVTGTAGGAGAVAHQRCQMHGLAGAIDAAVGVGEGIDGARLAARPLTPRSVRSKAAVAISRKA